MPHIKTKKKQPKRVGVGGVCEKYYFKISGAADIYKISVDSFVF